MTKVSSFPPIHHPSARVLILGSMPGVASLNAYQYYAHPRNRFWSIMSQLFSIPLELEYEQRCSQLIRNNIALWDVLASCQRTGSLDSNISSNSIVTNDFNTFLHDHNDIVYVFFNGTKAEKEYVKRVIPSLDEVHVHIQYQRLPSTSPAMASITLEQKIDHWSIVKKVLTIDAE